ncbi:hypothetical protein PIB30_088622, partial [Stylosanthes scabra]|nr:hypothetical protein [Stylosanthes scabra]
AGYGVSVDLQSLSKKGHRQADLDTFFAKANGSASILLLGFLLNAIASVFTSFALPKKA